MSRRPVAYPYAIPSPDLGPVYEAVGDAARIAEVYARAAVDFSDIKDARGLAYAIRSAAAALETAAEMAGELRPVRAERGAA